VNLERSCGSISPASRWETGCSRKSDEIYPILILLLAAGALCGVGNDRIVLRRVCVCAPELVCQGGRYGEQDLRLDNRAVLSRSSEDALAFGTPIRPVADQHLREQPIAEGVFGIWDCRQELVVCRDRLGVSFER
jgi:hypothetical protein